MRYNPDNIFARILRGEAKTNKIYEDKYALAFYDIMPRVKVHALVLPKGEYATAHDFYDLATEEEIVGFHRALSKVVRLLGIKHSGFRLVANQGLHSGQEVPHFHMHVLGGEALGPIILRQRDEP